MEMILKEIEAALAAKLYYLAVTLSLTLPDVCAALEAADGGTSSDRYKAWYTAHLGPTYGAMLTADDCCSLRCGVIHQGRFGDQQHQYSRVLFTIPNVQNNTFHLNVMNDPQKAMSALLPKADMCSAVADVR